MLRLLIIGPSGTFIQNNQVLGDVYDELMTLITNLDRRGVSVALWSREHLHWDGTAVEEHIMNDSGVDVKMFVAGHGGIPRKASKDGAAPMFEHFGVTKSETVLLGANESDLRAATNNGLLLLRPIWYPDSKPYGLEVSSIDGLRRFCELFGLREHPVYWRLEYDNFVYAAMGPFSTFKSELATIGADARAAAKRGDGTPSFWLLSLISALYFSGLSGQIDYLANFPGHDPDSDSAIQDGLDAVLLSLGQSLNKSYYRDLIIRHTRSVKSQTNPEARTFTNQLNTLRLNRRPHRNLSAKANLTSIDLRGKTVLVVDDICTSGHSLDSARALIEAAGGKAILFSWLKTINTNFTHMTSDPPLKPFSENKLTAEPPSQTFSYQDHVVDPQASEELRVRLVEFNAWRSA